ncbi:MAG: hypothetical protein LM587_01505 [Candidatus Aenigmarchaeota archaeon]|nr:hypothetical protein [Candidatus Aenigmarchaeota archaeon]
MGKIDALSKTIGIILAAFLVLEFFGIYTTILKGGFMGWLDILFIGFNIYIIHKIFFKKESLSDNEKGIAFVAIFFATFFTIIGFIAGFYQASKEKEMVTTEWGGEAALILIYNETVRIEPERYNALSLDLKGGDTVWFFVKSLNDGRFNTLLLNSSEFEKFSSGSKATITYYTKSYTSGTKTADITIDIPNTDTYYFIISPSPIVKGQENYSYPVDVLVRVYILNVTVS